MKKYKDYQIVLLALLSLLLNFGGKIVADRFRLPMWLDSFGTFLMAYVVGPFCAAIVGAAANILYGFLDPVSFAYSITSIAIALLVGYLAKYGWMRNLFKTMSLSVMLTGVSVVISCILNVIFYNGMTNNYWGDGIIAMLQHWNQPRWLQIIAGEFYVDFVDKVITLGALYFGIKIYRKIKIYLPDFLVLQEEKKPEELDASSSPGGVTSGSVKSILALLFVASIFALKPANAYATSKKFSSYIKTVYNNTNGLPGGESNDIASTGDGILWIGTYAGLYRHNGKEFRLMNEYDSIKTVRCLYADEYGKLLVGTNDNGFSIIENEEIICVCTEKDGLPADSIRCVTSAGDGVYYIGTTAELAVVEPYRTADGWKTGIRAVIPEVYSAQRLTSNGKGLVAAVASNGEVYLCQNEKLVTVVPLEGRKIISAAFGRITIIREVFLTPAFTESKLFTSLFLKIKIHIE